MRQVAMAQVAMRWWHLYRRLDRLARIVFVSGSQAGGEARVTP
jgi:hypothetical protein